MHCTPPRRQRLRLLFQTTTLNRLFSTLLDGLRLVLLRSPRAQVPLTQGPAVFIALIVVYLFAALVIAASGISGPVSFDPAGIATVLTDAMLTLLAAWLLVRLAGRMEIWGAASLCWRRRS